MQINIISYLKNYMKHVIKRTIPFDAPVYYDSKNKIRINERIVEMPFALRNIKGDKILDFGCCQSPLSLELSSLGLSVTGVDYNDYEFTHPNFKFIKGNFINVNINIKFDTILAISSIEHSGLERYSSDKDSKAEEKIMLKFNQLLKEKGNIIISVPFGIRKVFDKWMRVYDLSSFNKLCSNFNLVKKSYFKEKDHNWVKTSEKDACKVNSKKYAECVVCAVLEKNKILNIL